MHITGLLNHKGGTGKTTLCVNLAATLHSLGRKTVLVDIDFQCNLTYWVGGALSNRTTLVDALTGKVPPGGALRCADISGIGIDFMPGDPGLANVASGSNAKNLGMRLREKIEALRGYAKIDTVLLDFSPSLSPLTVAGMSVCDTLLIPVVCEPLSILGLSQMLDTVEKARVVNKGLSIAGVVLNRYDERTKATKEVLAFIQKKMPQHLFESRIRTNAGLSLLPSAHETVLDMKDPRGRDDFRALAREYLVRRG